MTEPTTAPDFSYDEKVRTLVGQINAAREAQPARLAKARADAELARDWALIEEPFNSQVHTLPSVGGGEALALPNLLGKEMFGARLAFDILDCGDNAELRNDVIGRYFALVEGDTGLAMLLMQSALSTIAGVVVPSLLEEIEERACNFDVRVSLAEARARAWSDRVGTLRMEMHANAEVRDAEGDGDEA